MKELEAKQRLTFEALVWSVAQLLATSSDEALAQPKQEHAAGADIALRNAGRTAAHEFVAADCAAVAAATTYLPAPSEALQ